MVSRRKQARPQKRPADDEHFEPIPGCSRDVDSAVSSEWKQLLADRPSTSNGTFTESPLRLLEKCVEPHVECADAAAQLGSTGKQSASFANAKSALANCIRMSNARLEGSVPSGGHKGTDLNAGVGGDALGELSQLVRKVGGARVQRPTKHRRTDAADNVFTCLQCSSRFDTLDELVAHISSTKHFSRSTPKRSDTLAPWEMNKTTSNSEVKHQRDSGSSSTTQKCALCGQTFHGEVEHHLRSHHNLDNFVDFLSLMKAAGINAAHQQNSVPLSKLQSLINGVEK